MKVLNICLLAPFTEGYSYQDNLLSEYQHKLGNDVTVLTTTRQRDSNGRVIKGEPCDRILDNGVRLIRIQAGNKLQDFFGYYPGILRIIENVSPDLIFIHGLCQFTPHFVIKYKKKNSNVILKADSHQDRQICRTTGFPFSQMIWFWKRCWKHWIKYFDRIYGTTSWRKDFAIEFYGIPERKTDILLLGVDTDNMTPDKDNVRLEIRKNLNINENTFVYIHGGKMNSAKKTIEILEAFSEINIPGIRLILFGSVGEDIKSVFNSLISHDERILYLGYIESKDVHKYYYASDFCLFPGNHSVLWEESIGCGLPGLFKDYGSYSHTNICGNSISIPSDATENDIRQVMTNVLNDKTFYSMLKNNAIKASKKLSYYDIARKSIIEEK